jgi:hypothetical protein
VVYDLNAFIPCVSNEEEIFVAAEVIRSQQLRVGFVADTNGVQIRPIQIKDLNPIVHVVTDIDAIMGHTQSNRPRKLSICSSMCTKSMNKFSM